MEGVIWHFLSFNDRHVSWKNGNKERPSWVLWQLQKRAGYFEFLQRIPEKCQITPKVFFSCSLNYYFRVNNTITSTDFSYSWFMDFNIISLVHSFCEKTMSYIAHRFCENIDFWVFLRFFCLRCKDYVTSHLKPAFQFIKSYKYFFFNWFFLCWKS